MNLSQSIRIHAFMTVNRSVGLLFGQSLSGYNEDKKGNDSLFFTFPKNVDCAYYTFLDIVTGLPS